MAFNDGNLKSEFQTDPLPKTATVIVGLPASGKTTFSQTFGVPVHDDVVPAQLYMIDPDLDFVINSPMFCIDKSLRNALDKLNEVFPNHNVNVIYFENDSDQCRINARNRAKKVDGLITYLSSKYRPPADARPVYKEE